MSVGEEGYKARMAEYAERTNEVYGVKPVVMRPSPELAELDRIFDDLFGDAA